MLTWLLDIGNSHTRIAAWRNGVMTVVRVMPTAGFEAGSLPEPAPAAAACVVPEVRRRLEDSELRIRFVDAAHCNGLIDFSGGDYSTLGADRVANAVALAAGFELPGAVVDCGTALTLEVVDSDRRFRGGAIMPGRALMSRVLHEGTAALPETPLDDRPFPTCGTNTRDALRFGIGGGVIGAVREWLDMVRRNLELKSVVLTGGDAAFLAAALPEAVVAPEDFTLAGVRLAAGIR